MPEIRFDEVPVETPGRKIFTVIGYWDAGPAFAQPVLGTDAHDAIRACAEEYAEGSNYCCIVAALEGDHQDVTFPFHIDGTAYTRSTSDLVGDDFEPPEGEDEDEDDEPPTLREPR